MTKVKNFFRTISVFNLKSAFIFYWLKYFKKDDDKLHQIRLRNGLTLSANKNAGDLTTLFEIFVNDDYDFESDKDSKINILDIGANVGYFSLYISKRFPNSSIFSFEPFGDTFKRLRENIDKNRAENIKPLRFAISDFNGTADFYSFEWAGCNTLHPGNFDENLSKKTTVDCIAFDKISEITGHTGFEFGKVDCEGSEYKIFLNSKDETIRSVKNYIIEVHNNETFHMSDLVSRFEQLGYQTEEKLNLLKARRIS